MHQDLQKAPFAQVSGPVMTPAQRCGSGAGLHQGLQASPDAAIACAQAAALAQAHWKL